MKRTLSQTALFLALAGGLTLQAAEGEGAGQFKETGKLPPGDNKTNGATKASVTARLDFDAFRIIAERNIFDPNRFPGMDSSRTRPRDPDRRVRTESFALLGTMSYEKGRYAFFDGSSSNYRKVLQPEGSIAEFKVAAVTHTCVKLQTTNGQTIDLCVGMQMSKREDEDWQVSERISDTGSSSNNSPAARSDNSGNADDVVRRMLQRREEEAGGAAAAPSPPAAVPPADPAPVPAPAAADKAPPDSGGGADDVVKRLLQKREQDLNK